ncbi:peroxisomal membrane protein pex14 [Lodderomyces elongisporus]|uniref:peroxisomal membrane protein pex14 n=1 Tax=Lodderomyces elongisporus TaxID=36914 RepID=UPI0029233C9E|nr:peroxisomal membrane protein pex14 [Lodderomyces elongisporus]WLF78991.1 peroxisomal membrane protein pex14 [Lodderomyces elongisporus]
MNDELINSAVAFLQDPNVATSPLAKKIEFLESKGLDQVEIEEAMKRANDPSHAAGTGTRTGTGTASSSGTTHAATTPSTSIDSARASPSSSAQQLPLDYYNLPPPVPERSWKDYFIMATATAGVTYGLYQVISRYLVPSILPPSQSSVEQDKQTINEEFIKIDKILEQLSKEQEEIKEANDEKLKDIDTVIENINDFLTKYNKDKLKFDDDLRLMKLEIDNLSNSVEKNMRLSKENINDELSGLNDELQSLKNLIKVRAENQANASGSGPNARNLAPVSSIPSASEILKKARAKTEAAKNPAAANGTNTGANADSNSTSATSSPIIPTTLESNATSDARPTTERTRSKNVTEGNVTAAGIPSWQIKHKEQELKQEEKGAEPEDFKNEEVIGIPSWQKAASQQQQTAASEDEIKEKIKSAGIPPWQLNNSVKTDSS